MRKFIAFLIIIYSCSATAREHTSPPLFILTHEGMKSEKGKDYVVLAGLSFDKVQLFKMLLNNLVRSFNGPDDKVTKVENESITVIATGKHATYIKAPRFKTSYDVTYTFHFEIMDGKLKVWAPVINRMHNIAENKDMNLFVSETTMSDTLTSPICPRCVKYIFKGDKLKLDKTKDVLESFLNDKMKLAMRLMQKPGE